ncbi:DUF6630 family protein [Brachybacterium tyrofermentans]|uniref:DUF6630 family protein n=1 Tax=Brachybacterium tyrofermentans TaxID=47848 RepID=UPI003FD33E0D
MPDWTRLCTLLADDPELPGSVHLAATDPQAYLSTQADPLLGVEAGAGAAEPVDPWNALIDGLDVADALAYLDPEDTGAELAMALGEVARVCRSGADLEPIADITAGLEPAIRRAEEILAAFDLCLLHLEEDTDACPLVVADIGHVEEIVALAAGAGREVRPVE